MRRTRLLTLLAALSLSVAPACSPGSTGDATDDALTLDDASKFVVSATPDRIVLQKQVADATFPLEAADLVGKALMIHPIKGRAEGGVFSWARKVEDTGSQIIVQGELLDFDDLMQLDADPRGEDRIVRIYVDDKLVPVDKAPNTATPQAALTASSASGGLTTRSLDLPIDLGLEPRGLSGALTGEFPQVWIWTELSKRGSGFANVSDVQSDGFKANFNTTFGIEKGRSIDLGFSFNADWKVSFRLNAVAGGREPIFETKQLPLLERAGFIPISGVPVPAMLRVYAYSGCYAVGGLKFSGKITAGVHVAASASVRFSPREGEPEKWIEPGNLPNALDVTPFVEAEGVAPSAGIMCHVGRVNADLEIGRICRGPLETCGAMVIAPYLGLVPQVFVSDGALIGQEPGLKSFLSASLRFGAWGKLFGRGVSAELDLLRWAPDRLPAEAR